jgi:hypothetical protein
MSLGIPTSWSALKAIISETMKDQKPDEVIRVLETRIQTTKGNDAKGRLAGTFRTINIREPLSLTFGLHAEMVLGSLGSKECRDIAIRNGDGTLTELCEVRWRTLSCPPLGSDRLTIACR